MILGSLATATTAGGLATATTAAVLVASIVDHAAAVITGSEKLMKRFGFIVFCKPLAEGSPAVGLEPYSLMRAAAAQCLRRNVFAEPFENFRDRVVYAQPCPSELDPENETVG
jgi:hypothetical protein